MSLTWLGQALALFLLAALLAVGWGTAQGSSGAFLVALLLVLAAGCLAERWLWRPLRELATRLARSGGGSAPELPGGVHELQQLAHAFRAIQDSLRHDRSEQLAIEQHLAQGRKALALLQLEVLEARIERERIERSLLTVAEREQERLGRELHDGVGQELAGAAFLAKALATRLAAGTSPLAADAEWIKQVLLQSIESVRSLSRQLSPTELERGDPLAALDRLCSDAERVYGIACSLQVSASARPVYEGLAAHAARQFYRVTQEALNNATRHGACRQIQVRLDARAASLRLGIADDGLGIPRGLLQQFATLPGMGLHSMRLRARSLGGQVRLGRHCQRTLVIMRVPLAGLQPGPALAGVIGSRGAVVTPS